MGRRQFRHVRRNGSTYTSRKKKNYTDKESYLLDRRKGLDKNRAAQASRENLNGPFKSAPGALSARGRSQDSGSLWTRIPWLYCFLVVWF